MWFVEILAISINPRGLSIGDRIAHTQVIEDTPGSSIGFLSIILLTLLASAYSLPRLNQQIQQRAQLLLTFAFNSAANYVPAIRDAGEPRTIKPDDFYQIVKPIWGRFRLDAGFTIQGPLGTGNLHGTFLDHPLQVKAQKWTFHTADLLIKVDYYELLVSRGQWNSIVEQFKADQSVLFSQDPYVRSILLRVAPMVARSFQQLGDKPKAAYYYALAAKLLAENSSRDPNVKNYLEQAEQLDPTNDLIGQVKKLTHK
jgi:hypothetical protein